MYTGQMLWSLLIGQGSGGTWSCHHQTCKYQHDLLGTECDSQSAVPKLNVLPLVFAMLPEGHHCLHWHWSVGIGRKCPAESPTMNLNPWKTRPVISAGGGEQRNISFTFRVNPNLIQGRKQEGMARLYCSKQMEHVERDGRILPFSARIPNDRL